MSLQKLFGTTVFLGAFLLFLIQPIIGKFFLPVFGGGSQVWSVSLMFFMTALLAGYLYAHLLSTFSKRIQVGIHILLLAAGFFASFAAWTTFGKESSPQFTAEAAPEIQLLRMLFLSIGIPYLILSATGPLLQNWYAKLNQNKSPYRLYALSNFASLLAIGSYPFLVEPLAHLETQRIWWTFAFWVFLALFLCTMFLFAKLGVWSKESGVSILKVGPKLGTKWTVLAFVPAVLLLAVTNEITQGIAPMPFLWLLPLGVYLISFIIAFSVELEEKVITGLSAILVASVMTLVWGEFSGMEWVLRAILYLLVLFLAGMVCHGFLYRQRPGNQNLTKFYLFVAAGGALAGIFVSLIAPHIFRDFWETDLALFLSLAAALWILHLGLKPFFSARHAALISLIVAAIFSMNILEGQKAVIKQSRNFYGVLKVKKQQYTKALFLYTLYNGDILHGSQFSGPGYSKLAATTYYTVGSGIGAAFSAHPIRARGLRVGAIGLGVGTVAAYCQGNDYFRFYEINPAVIEVAQTDFSYLKNCLGLIDIVEGDARIALTKELREGKPQRFDILVLDAFTDDSIPVHLLTQEAFEIYLSHLEPTDGAIAVHISNRYLNFEPVVLAAARHFNMVAETKYSNSFEHDGRPSIWMLLRRKKEVETDTSQNLLLWTDSYSALWPLFKR